MVTPGTIIVGADMIIGEVVDSAEEILTEDVKAVDVGVGVG